MRSASLLICVLLLGCSPGSGRPDSGGGGDVDSGPGFVDSGPRRDAGFMGCIGTPYEAEEAFAPIDIVWVVDTSGSMSDEAERVAENMESFATAIGAVGLDWHVVMISTQAFVNVPASLAADPRYLLIERGVSSNEPLRALLAEFPRYMDHLRRNAVTHMIAVTDDNSDLEWETFQADMRRNLMRNFIFHTISSELAGPATFMYPDGQPCSSGGGFPPEGAAEPGIEYWDLATATGGRKLSICTPAAEWATLFNALTAAIAIPQSIPCEYAVPEPPAGGELDFGRVNVVYTPGGGGPAQVFPYVGTADGADCTSGGWYYDDVMSPTRIILCPSSCSAVSGDAEGRIDVELGCLTYII